MTLLFFRVAADKAEKEIYINEGYKKDADSEKNEDNRIIDEKM